MEVIWMVTSLSNKRGSSYILTAVIILVISMMLSVVLIYASTMTIIQTTKENTQRCLDSFVMQNSTLIYQSIKEGNDFTEHFDQKAFIQAFNDELSMDLQNGMLYCVGDKGEVVFKMTIPAVTYKVNNTLNLKASYDLLIPLNFAGQKISDIKILIVVDSNYTLK